MVTKRNSAWGKTLKWTIKILFALWAIGFFSYLLTRGGVFLAIGWATLFFGAPYFPLTRTHASKIVAGCVLLPLVIFFSRQPSHQRKWLTEYEKLPSVELVEDQLTIRNFREFDYEPDGEPIPKWSTRTFDLSQLENMDIFMAFWDSQWVGHPIFSFDFGDQGHLAFTIEARREKGEEYSVTAGLYRRYELLYIPCRESDAVRDRTNFREGETVHLYRTIATPEQSRARLLEFVKTTNEIYEKPRFYNIIFSNCTTAVRSQIEGGFPFDWRIILNGKLDEMLYEKGIFQTQGLSLPELKRENLINPRAREISDSGRFSEKIREGVPGFADTKKGGP